MNQCSICNGQVHAWTQIRIADGCICRSCANKIPSIIKSQVTELSADSVRQLIEYENNPLFERFSATSSYGSIHLDEMNGLFAISNKLTSDAKPDDPCSIFHVLDLTEVGLYCVKPRLYRNGVAVDVEFNFIIERLNIQYKDLVRQQVFCSNRKVDSTHVSWDEPGDLSMFRNMFNQSIKNEEIKLKKKYEQNFISKKELDVFKAKCLFMIEDGFSKSELKKQRNILIRAFHSDVSPHSDVYAKKINEAYSILLPYAID